MKVLLLPGLDGTSELFARFLACAPTELDCEFECVRLPCERPRSYEELCAWLEPKLTRPVTLLAESFSGPLAVLAARHPSVSALVLCATFVEPPWPGVFARLPTVFGAARLPTPIIALGLTGGDLQLASEVRSALASVPSEIVVSRSRQALSVRVGSELSALEKPVLYLRARDDRIVFAHCGERIRTLNPKIELVDVEGPHLLLQARSALAWAHIAPFLVRVAAERSG